jgi:hypothetical protein
MGKSKTQPPPSEPPRGDYTIVVYNKRGDVVFGEEIDAGSGGFFLLGRFILDLWKQ